MKNFKSDRFSYIRINESHASDTYLSWLDNKTINQYLEVRHSKNDMESLKSYLNSVSKSNDEYLYGIFSGKEHIGNIKIGPVHEIYKHADIGLIIGNQNWWNKGVASEAIYSMTKYCFNELKLVKVEAGCYESNIYSKKAFLKLGYEVEGYIRDHVFCNGNIEGVYKLGITQKDWELKTIINSAYNVGI